MKRNYVCNNGRSKLIYFNVIYTCGLHDRHHHRKIRQSLRTDQQTELDTFVERYFYFGRFRKWSELTIEKLSKYGFNRIRTSYTFFKWKRCRSEAALNFFSLLYPLWPRENAIYLSVDRKVRTRWNHFKYHELLNCFSCEWASTSMVNRKKIGRFEKLNFRSDSHKGWRMTMSNFTTTSTWLKRFNRLLLFFLSTFEHHNLFCSNVAIQYCRAVAIENVS